MIRNKSLFTLLFGMILLAISIRPIYIMFIEINIHKSNDRRYFVQHADMKDGFPVILQRQQINVFNHQIRILEEDTGRFAPLTLWDKDEGVPPGEIIKVQMELDGKIITEPSEIWLSNRHRGSRYFSWMDVLIVQDKETREVEIAIVQRVTDDNNVNRKWRIIHVNEAGGWTQEDFGYLERANHPLGVKLVMVSGTSLISMGYETDILQGYPSLFFPLLYPFASTVLSLILIFIFIFNVCRKVKRRV